MAIMQCPSCGYLIVNPSQPCPSCGNSAAPSVAEHNPSLDQYDDYHESFSKKAIAAVIIIFLACTGVFYFYKNSHGKTRSRLKEEKVVSSPNPSETGVGAISKAQRTADAVKTRGGPALEQLKQYEDNP